MPTTLLQCFEKPLPYYPNFGDPKRKATISGHASTNAKPPVFGFDQPIKHWHDIAEEYLEQNEVQEILKKDFIPKREHGLFHFVKADIVRSGQQYLIHPIIKALNAMGF